MAAKEEDGGGGKDWECGISRCKLLYIGWINKSLPYRNHMEKNMKRIYVYITESLCCAAKKDKCMLLIFLNYTSIKLF